MLVPLSTGIPAGCPYVNCDHHRGIPDQILAPDLQAQGCARYLPCPQCFEFAQRAVADGSVDKRCKCRICGLRLHPAKDPPSKGWSTLHIPSDDPSSVELVAVTERDLCSDPCFDFNDTEEYATMQAPTMEAAKTPAEAQERWHQRVEGTQLHQALTLEK